MAKTFTYLDGLIHSGDEELSLDDDIVLSPEEEEKYQNGINVDADYLIIDGNSHTIDARGLARIFNLNGDYCYLYDITFENGFSKVMS